MWGNRQRFRRFVTFEFSLKGALPPQKMGIQIRISNQEKQHEQRPGSVKYTAYSRRQSLLPIIAGVLGSIRGWEKMKLEGRVRPSFKVFV